MAEFRPPASGAEDPAAGPGEGEGEGAGEGALPSDGAADVTGALGDASSKGAHDVAGDGPVTDETPPAPTVPAIDLSEPEQSEPQAPIAIDDPVVPEPVPTEPLPDPSAPAATPVAPSAPHPPAPDVPVASDAQVAPPSAPAADEASPSPPLPPPASDAVHDTAAGKDEVARFASRPPVAMIVAAAALVVVLVVAIVVVNGLKDNKQPTVTAPTSTTVNTTPVSTADWVTFTDEASGFTLKHPKDWKVLREPAGEERLLLSAGQRSYLRVTAINEDPSKIVQGIQQGMAGVKLVTANGAAVQPQSFLLHGLQAFLYIYNTPASAGSAIEGVHVHYFVVRGSKVYTMVFQALPRDELNRLARTFSAVAESFRSTSDAPAPDPLPTTTPTTAAGTTPTT